MLRRKLKCRDTLWLIATIIDASNPQEDVLEYFPGDESLEAPAVRRHVQPSLDLLVVARNKGCKHGQLTD
jgi:hypothetical protein